MNPFPLIAVSDLVRVLTLQDYNTRVVLMGTTLFGACSGVVGAFMLLRKKSLAGDLASHAALPGIGLAYLIHEAFSPGSGKSVPWLLAGAGIGAAAGLGCSRLIQKVRLVKEDAALGIVLSVFFGMGVVLLSIVQQLPTGSAGLNDFVFGKAASLTSGDVQSIALASGLVLVVCAAFFKEFSLLCFDEEYAAALGWPVGWIDVALTSLVVIVTVIGMPSVGLLLVVAMLIIPPTAARFWTDRVGTMTMVSALIGAISAATGVILSALIPRLAAGAVIVLAGTTAFTVSLFFGTRRGIIWAWRTNLESRRRSGELDLLRACYELVEVADAVEMSVELQSQSSMTGALVSKAMSIESLRNARPWSKGRLETSIANAQSAGLIRLDSQNQYRLTEEGARRAKNAARNHRLWEMYLIHHADLAPNRVDREADYHEHALEPQLVEQLEMLIEKDMKRGEVPSSPHGPIATSN